MAEDRRSRHERSDRGRQQQTEEEQGHGVVTIRNIRLFGQSWAPEYFRKCGWRGWWLRALNVIRWRLEVRVQWHAQYLLKSRLGENVDTLWADWQKDVLPPTRTFADRDVLMHPPIAPDNATKLGSVHDTNQMIARLTAHPRSKRYAYGRRRFTMYDVEPTGESTDAEDTATGSGGIEKGSS